MINPITIEEGGKTLRPGQSEGDRKRELFAREGWICAEDLREHCWTGEEG
jgi:hypothetical protein